MKFKNLSLVAGAIALTLTATSWAVNAETISSSPFLIAQEQSREMRGPWQKLGLTDAQKTQLQEIRRNTREEIDRVLTEEQRAQLNNAMQNQNGKRGGWRGIMNSLNLSEAQKTQIREIKRSQKTKMEAILTPEQKAQLDEIKNQMRARRQQYQQNKQ
ncbi:P pilus assembly/Cpx signaling pathway, periplasmic inhibitor/zinc-resistance associated protein [Scytonema sp. UIC 10036]|uniref:Spy/CpxP family protein refolding chaperone n=1 Tax=Scytonema sp. UIC 10036 TaxID=2304196 RepID=UPI0012DA6A41|nr:P pilus assembly/Cpx signaling pathway, periplasmic inhibitor/zinc-resistance associated protein [Scytonema sp. UIC 10036]MUH00155.1 P pilus assembly/Cpx signaling pathway, periplasmic inhibitor/zinc-resistance associated protein [Scytonema sp. UIC 10036]